MEHTASSFKSAWEHGRILNVEGYDIPKPRGIRPLHALKSAYRLRDNKEDTSQVYQVTGALSGSQYVYKFRKFAQTEYGRKVLDGEVRVNDLLTDWDMLGALPDGSVGRAYYDFMQEENLDPNALREASAEAGLNYTDETYFPAYCRQINHFQVTHDLWHILSGYGRDALGELALLNFYRGQWPDRGLGLITWVGGRSILQVDNTIPARDVLKEGLQNGKSANWIMSYDPADYISLPVEEVRAMMNIACPATYLSMAPEKRQVFYGTETALQAA